MTLPERWQEAALGDVCRIVSGATPKTGVPEFWGGEIRWITPNDLSKDRSQTLTTGERSLTQAGYDSCSARLFPAGSVVVSSRAPVGYVAIAGAEMCSNQGCKTAVPPDTIDSKYLYWYMVAAKPDLEARASGTTFKEISSKRFAETRLRWPDLAEQRRIVAILEDHLSRLDAAADYVAASRRRIAALERAALDRHFGGMEAPLADLIQDISAGKSFGAASAPAKDGEWGIIKVSAMTWGEFDPGENKTVAGDRIDPRFEIHEGDLLVSRANTAEYVGSSVLVGPVRPKLLLSDKSLRVTPKDDVSSEWLWRALQAPSARRQITALATGTKESMRNISQGALKQVLLPRAGMDRQRQALAAFGDVSAANSGLRDAVESADRRLTALRRSLLAAAFSGRLTGSARDMSDSEEMIGA